MTVASRPEPDGVATDDAAERPLRGIRVIEAASYVSAPFAGMMLAQLGAEVVKVEPPAGDPMRRFGLRHEGLSAFFVNLNHGKQSLVLNLKDEVARKKLLDLIDDADVFLQNWRPGVAASLGLAAEDLTARNPRLVYAALSGYGEDGPRATGPVFDLLLQGASGLAAYESGGQRPDTMRSYLVDKTTACFAAQSILAARCTAATQTGRGSVLSLSMLDVMAYFNFPDMCQDRTFLSPAAQTDLEKSRSNVLRTRDGYLVLSPVSGRQLAGAVTAAGHPEWKDELKAATTPTALMNRFLELMETETTHRATGEWERIFLDHDVPAAPVLSVDEHLGDAQTLHNELYSSGESPVGPVRRVRHPIRIDGRYLPEVESAPGLETAQPG